jgi:hypothetical protein
MCVPNYLQQNISSRSISVFTLVRHHIVVTLVAKHLHSSSLTISICCITVMTSHMYARNVIEPLKSSLLSTIISAFTQGKNHLPVRHVVSINIPLLKVCNLDCVLEDKMKSLACSLCYDCFVLQVNITYIIFMMIKSLKTAHCIKN